MGNSLKFYQRASLLIILGIIAVMPVIAAEPALTPFMVIPWGDKPGEIGRATPNEEKIGIGTNSIMLSGIKSDLITVNDPINMRINKYKITGELVESTPVPGYRYIQYISSRSRYGTVAIDTPTFFVATRLGDIGKVQGTTLQWIPLSLPNIQELHEFNVTNLGNFIVGHRGLYDKDDVVWHISSLSLKQTGVIVGTQVRFSQSDTMFTLAGQEWQDNKPIPGTLLKVNEYSEDMIRKTEQVFIPGTKEMTAQFAGVFTIYTTKGTSGVVYNLLFFNVKDKNAKNEWEEKIVRYSTRTGVINGEFNLTQPLAGDISSSPLCPGRVQMLRYGDEIVVAVAKEKQQEFYKLKVVLK